MIITIKILDKAKQYKTIKEQYEKLKKELDIAINMNLKIMEQNEKLWNLTK